MPTLQLEKSVTLKNIVVATDFSEASHRAVEYAVKIAMDNNAQLYVIHATPPEVRGPVPLDPLPIGLDRDFRGARQNLAQLAQSERLQYVRHEEILNRGSVWDVVQDVTEKRKADLLVVGTHGRGNLGKLVLGSVAEQIFRQATCPVLTVGPSATIGGEIRKVLYATEFGAASLHALPYAIDFADHDAGELILLHLAPPYAYARYAVSPEDLVNRQELAKRKILPKLRSLLPSPSGLRCGVTYLVDLRLSTPEDGIASIAKERHAELIVIGVRESGLKSPRLAAHMPWAIAYEVVRESSCPVLTVRA